MKKHIALAALITATQLTYTMEEQSDLSMAVCSNKTEKLFNLAPYINDQNYKTWRPNVIKWVQGGADVNIQVIDLEVQKSGLETATDTPLLIKAMGRNDTELIEILLKHNANPNINYLSVPALFYAKKVKIAKLLAYGGATLANLSATNKNGDNLLWHVVNNNDFSLKLIPFYLNCGVGINSLNPTKGAATLLYELINKRLQKPSRSIIKATEAIITQYPTIINIPYVSRLWVKGTMTSSTPLDQAQKALELAPYGKATKIIEELITLLKEYDAKTRYELSAENGLRSFTARNIQQMSNVGSNDNITIVIHVEK